MNVIISSYSSEGLLSIISNQKEYTYPGVGKYHLEQIQKFIDRRDKNLWPYLKQFSEENHGQKRVQFQGQHR